MTKLLAQAFEEASRLSEDLQDQLAQELLEVPVCLQSLARTSSWSWTTSHSPRSIDRK